VPDTHISPNPSAATNPSGSTTLAVSLSIPTGPTSKLSPKALDALARLQAQAQAAKDAGHITQAIRLAERASALVAYRQGGDVVERYKKVQLNANASNLFGISANSDTFEGYQLVLTTNAVEAGPGIVTNPPAYFTAKSALVQAMNQINGAAGGAINLNQLFRSLDQAWAVVDFAAQMGQAAGTGITIVAVNFATGAIQMVSHPIDSIANLMNVIANIDTVMEMAYVKVEAYMTTPHSAADLAQLEATIVASIIPMLSGGGVVEAGVEEAVLTKAAAELASEAVPYLTDAVAGAAKLRSLAPKLLTQLKAEGVDAINVAAAAAKSSDVAVTIVADAVETAAIDAVDAGQVMRVVDSARKAKIITTPQGPIKQAMDAKSIASRAQVTGSETKLYRTGTSGRSNTGDQAQYWSLEHPSTPGYADRHGIDSSNVREANFIEEAVIKQDTDFVTRPAAAWGDAKGGAIEVVVPEGGVRVTKHTSFEN